MKNLYVNVSRETRMVDLPKQFIAVDGENLQSKLVFTFIDEFVNGQARLEYEIKGNKNYIVLNKENETYTIPVKSVITKEGQIDMQIVITEITDGEEIPVFKSNKFYLYCNSSINAVEEAPDGYNLWIEIANAKLNAMDKALEEVDKLDLDVEKEENKSIVIITKKDGSQKSVEIKDGYTPVKGKDYYTETEKEELVNEVKEKIDLTDYAKTSELPTKISDLNNDSNFIEDSNYVHTDNNYTDEYKDKLDGLSNYDDTSIKEEISSIKEGKADKNEIPDISNLVDEQSLTEALKTKQDTLILGNNIVIKDGVISAKERTWKKVRTITIPSDDYKGQEIDGVKYEYSVSSDGGIKSITFSTDEDGEPLSEHNITGAIIRLTPTENINITQGFVSINNNGLSASAGYAIDYFLNIKATTTLRWFEYSLQPYFAAMITDNPGRYRFPAQYTHKQINDFNFGGFEAASVLGEGTKLEIWMYGYWD